MQLLPLFGGGPVAVGLPVSGDIGMAGVDTRQRTAIGALFELLDGDAQAAIEQGTALDFGLVERTIPDQDVYGAIGLATGPGIYQRPGPVSLQVKLDEVRAHGLQQGQRPETRLA